MPHQRKWNNIVSLSARRAPALKSPKRYLLMAGCSSFRGAHSRVLLYVLVFPINIQKCLVITRSGFIYMQSASVVRNCSGKVFFFVPLCDLFSVSVLFFFYSLPVCYCFQAMTTCFNSTAIIKGQNIIQKFTVK